MRPITWSEAKPGQDVYLKGTDNGAVRFYGPHRVLEPEKRRLENRRGVTFRHYPENLWEEERV